MTCLFVLWLGMGEGVTCDVFVCPLVGDGGRA